MAIKPRMMFAHMRSAVAYGVTSYARRLQVGCVIVNPETDQPVAIGWNGTPPGMPNVCEMEQHGQIVTNPCVIHAEENALMRIPENVDDFTGLVMFVTHSPCPDCTQKIIDNGKIDKVYYQEPYRIMDGIKRLMNAGIEVYRMVGDMTILKHVFDDQGEVGYEQILSNPDKVRN